MSILIAGCVSVINIIRHGSTPHRGDHPGHSWLFPAEPIFKKLMARSSEGLRTVSMGMRDQHGIDSS